ncbi:MAG: hypothetical protein Q7U77_14525 [Sediminibacterium sp.]|uniref:hypothetical protein n=1 Tax=Sediminibacterium sp. TaxID=1917865 RepID=UPI0027228A87|nr:hypothetical protein [Sediminibacterium sp.]MDO8997838.1 hypothetical protein [Sediminibacterium sp.]
MSLATVQSQYLTFFPPQNLTTSYVITTNWLLKPHESGFPEELTYKAYDTCYGLQVKKPVSNKNKIKVTFISNKGENEELFFLIRIISLFNKMPSIQRTIYCSRTHIEYLKQIANEGIEFRSREENQLLETEVILCFGSSAIHFLLSGIPVIIVGTFGLGGIITPENFELLLKKGFMGRPGGTYNEEIPIELLAEEILEVQHNKILFNQTVQIQALIKKKQFFDYDTLYNQLETFNIDYWLNDIKRRWQIDMQLVSNIQILSKAKKTFLVRQHINDVMASFEEEEAMFFKYLLERRTAKEAFNIAAIPIKDFWLMVSVLWDKKIIILYV